MYRNDESILIEKEARSAAASIDESDGRSLSERAYDALLDRMLSGELPAGTLLQERPLADALQISRTPVREALGEARIRRAGHPPRRPPADRAGDPGRRS